MHWMLTDVTVISVDCAMTGDCMLNTGLLLWVACILLRLVGRSVRREWGWGNPECQQRITEVCPYVGGRTTEQRGISQGNSQWGSPSPKYDSGDRVESSLYTRE
jgi:hypothetical protein